MDPIRRGDDKLRRFYRASNLAPNTPVRSILDNSQQNSLRQTIRKKMFAFVLPGDPISDSNVTCTHVRLEVAARHEFAADYSLYARIKAKIDARLAVAFGFNFYAGGRYMLGITGLNYPGLNPDTTILWLHGPSHWLANNLGPAFNQGVNFRIHSTTDMQKNLRDFAFELLGKLDGPKNRLMGWFDEDGERDYTQSDATIASFNYSDIFAESGVQPNLTFPIGLLYDEFFS